MNGKCRGKAWHGAWLLCCCCIVAAMCLSVQAFASEADRGANGFKKTGELSCTGAVRYQSGAGAWLTQGQGSIPIILPVSIQTDKASCRLSIKDLGLFEADPASKMTLTRSADKKLTLTLEKGSVYYSLSRAVELKINTPLPGVNVRFVASRPGTDNLIKTPTGITYVGGASIEAGGSLHVVNLSGATLLEQNGKTVRELGTGRDLEIKLNTKDTAGAVSAVNLEGTSDSNPNLIMMERSAMPRANVSITADATPSNNAVTPPDVKPPADDPKNVPVIASKTVPRPKVVSPK